MDFSYSEEQEAVRELAGRIFTERVTHERLKEIEQADAEEGPFDRPRCGVSGPDSAVISVSPSTSSTAAPALDFVAACLVVEAAGRSAIAYVPLVRDTGLQVRRPIAQFGTPAQRQAWLPGVSSGDTILTAALAELVGEVILPGGTSPATTAQQPQPDGSWVLDGPRPALPAAFVAGHRHPRPGLHASGIATGAGRR